MGFFLLSFTRVFQNPLSFVQGVADRNRHCTWKQLVVASAHPTISPSTMFIFVFKDTKSHPMIKGIRK